MQIRFLCKFGSLLIYLCVSGIVSGNYFTTYSNASFVQGGATAKPGCPSKCGDLTVPYPFGIGVNATCSANPAFDINCDASFNPPKAFLGEFQVLDISETKVRINNRVTWSCYDRQHRVSYEDSRMDFSGTPFSLSDENMLTVVGCDDVALISRDTDDGRADYVSSCVAVCSKPGDLRNGFCSGTGCCQASIPKDVRSFNTAMNSLNKHGRVNNFSRCGYSFLAEQNSYNFNVSDISDPSFINRIIPLVVDWAIGNQSCNQIGDTSEIICQEQSECIDSGSGLGGYRCNCSQGYQGNPYLSTGCQDINECEFTPCHQKATCTNLQGSYNCSCSLYYIGDGTKNGTGCIFWPNSKKFILYGALPVELGLFSVSVFGLWLFKFLKKRRLKQLKQKNFKRNGGLLLQKQMSSHDSVLEKMRIFTSKELEMATDQFNESRILGQGGQGTVYKGMISDGRNVAVKKSKLVDKIQQVEFINEVIILSQIKHRNVVELLGCCLETEVPLLVYEFIPNGTLYHLINDHNTCLPFSWDQRLRIATEIANALACLHYSCSIPIYHRDMKSTNILLDEKYKAKLSDFGISRSVAIDQTHLTTLVKGTFGYLDPEYFRTGKFTEKSDVYSFGVVLVELLTGQKPIETGATEEDRSLVNRFLSTMEENHLNTILDSRIIEQGVNEEHIVVSDLAKRCLNLKGKRRPTIREVATELESIRACENPSFIESNNQDTSCIEIEPLVFVDYSSSFTGNVGCTVKTDEGRKYPSKDKYNGEPRNKTSPT